MHTNMGSKLPSEGHRCVRLSWALVLARWQREHALHQDAPLTEAARGGARVRLNARHGPHGAVIVCVDVV